MRFKSEPVQFSYGRDFDDPYLAHRIRANPVWRRRYGRPGRIPASVNVPASSLLDPDSLCIKSPAEVAAAFDAQGAAPEKRILTYCGGGIAASSNAFILTLLGVEKVALYNGSMTEWSADPALPMEVDD